MNELSQTVEELRTAAKLLISAAESIANLIGILNNQKLKELWQRRTVNENS